MTYLVAADLPTDPAGERFRALLERARASCSCPAPTTGSSALQARARRVRGALSLGRGDDRPMGLPDLGIITVDEVCFFIRQMARASGLPVLVDGDTGYGEALNVMHMVRSFEDAGAAAVHIEDQLLPKKCGHLNDKKLADPQDMAAKIAAAAQRPPASGDRRPHRCRRAARGWTARWRARSSISGGRRRDLPRSPDDGRNVPRIRRAGASAAARQHDRVRPDPVLHRGRVPGHGVQDGDLAGQLAPGRGQGAGRALCRHPPRRRHPGDARRACRPAAELYETIGYHEYEALDASIVTTVVPQGMPQG